MSKTADHFVELFGGGELRTGPAAGNEGMWSWLALVFLRELCRPVRGGDVHVRAIERLDVAVDDLERASEESAADPGRPAERTATVALAAANEQVAAREAWVKYIEHGY